MPAQVPRVLFVGNGDPRSAVLASRLQNEGYDVHAERGIALACATLSGESFPVLVADLPAVDTDAFTLLRAAGRCDPPTLTVLCFRSFDGVSAQLTAIREAALACLISPISPDDVLAHVAEATALCKRGRTDDGSAEHGRTQDADFVPAERRLAAVQRVVAAAAEVQRPAGLGALRRVTARAALEGTGAAAAWVMAWRDGEQQVTAAPDGASLPLAFANEVRLAARPLKRGPTAERPGCYLGVHIGGEAARAGAIIVAHDTERDPDAGHQALLSTLAQQLAAAERNAALAQELDLAYDATWRVLTKALEIRDGYTGQHSQRVAAVAREIALELGVAGDSPELAGIERAAALHDVGKIGISDATLCKTGALTDEEWDEMRGHSELGYRILEGVDHLADVAEAVYASHERWDGHGYPRGLAGDEIPRDARIVFLADAWDAMTSDRPYRTAMSPAGARQEVRDHGGTQFDPSVVEAFERVVERWDAERERGRAA